MIVLYILIQCMIIWYVIIHCYAPIPFSIKDVLLFFFCPLLSPLLFSYFPLDNLHIFSTFISIFLPFSFLSLTRGETGELRREVLAGLVVALATIPTSVAYSSVIGLSPLVSTLIHTFSFVFCFFLCGVMLCYVM